MTCSWAHAEDFHFVQSSKWADAGLQHGFIGSSADFSPAGLQEWLPRFCRAFDVGSLMLPQQVHGNTIFDLRGAGVFPSGSVSCDGLVISRQGDQKRAFGIRTADCLPILMFDCEKILLLHAGWRGIAAGIIEEGARRLGRGASVLIGPAAGRDRYEVGGEVLEAIGERAHFSTSGRGRFLLDLQSTAARIIHRHRPDAEIERIEICTISDSRFHSYRREGAPVRSNLAFVAGL